MKNKLCPWLLWIPAGATAFLLATGCARVRVEPVEVNVQPIHVTVDVNVKVQKVDRALDDFFADIAAPAGAESPRPQETAP